MHGNEIRREAVSRDSAAPVVPAAHTHASADAHGECRVLAHEKEIRSRRVGEIAELVVIEHVDEVAERIDVRFRNGFGLSVDINDFVVGHKRIALRIDERRAPQRLCRAYG